MVLRAARGRSSFFHTHQLLHFPDKSQLGCLLRITELVITCIPDSQEIRRPVDIYTMSTTDLTFDSEKLQIILLFKTSLMPHVRKMEHSSCTRGLLCPPHCCSAQVGWILIAETFLTE